MTETDRRCHSCGSPLASDNAGEQCGSCQSADRDQIPSPPVVPPEFWETEHMRTALRSRHMGKVIRAYRLHRHHGYRGLSQDHVARWAAISQGQLSRLENGPPPLRMDLLAYWARLLGIPKQYHWFVLPADDRDTSTDPLQELPGAAPTESVIAGQSDAELHRDDAQQASATRDRSSETMLASMLSDLKDELREELKEELKSPVAEMQHSAAPEPDADAASPGGETARRPPARSATAPTRGTVRRVRDRRPASDVSDPIPIATGIGDNPRHLDMAAGTSASTNVDMTPTLPNPPIHIDIEAAQPARIADYLLGGNANFSIDREVIEYIIAALPGGGDTARTTTRAARAFQRRVVRFLASETGVRQFLNLSARVPPTYSIHETAQEIAPDARVVYVINDDVVLAHAHRLQPSTVDGVTEYVRGDPREPEKVIRDAAAALDFSLPMAIMVFGAVHMMGRSDAAYGTIARLLDGVTSGSYLVMTHLASDLLGEEMAEAIQRLDHTVEQKRMMPLVLRSHDEVRGFFDGLELLEPGVVPVDRWRPDDSDGTSGVGSNVFIYGAVGRKP